MYNWWGMDYRLCVVHPTWPSVHSFLSPLACSWPHIGSFLDVWLWFRRTGSWVRRYRLLACFDLWRGRQNSNNHVPSVCTLVVLCRKVAVRFEVHRLPNHGLWKWNWKLKISSANFRHRVLRILLWEVVEINHKTKVCLSMRLK